MKVSNTSRSHTAAIIAIKISTRVNSTRQLIISLVLLCICESHKTTNRWCSAHFISRPKVGLTMLMHSLPKLSCACSRNSQPRRRIRKLKMNYRGQSTDYQCHLWCSWVENCQLTRSTGGTSFLQTSWTIACRRAYSRTQKVALTRSTSRRVPPGSSRPLFSSQGSLNSRWSSRSIRFIMTWRLRTTS